MDLLARAALDPGADDMERTDGQHTVIAMVSPHSSEAKQSMRCPNQDLGLGVFDATGLKGDLGPIVERRKKRKRTRMEDGLRKGNDGELEDEMVNGDEEEAGSINESEDTEDRHTDSEDATPSDSSSDTTSEESDGTTGEDNHEEDDGDGGSDHTDGESR